MQPHPFAPRRSVTSLFSNLVTRPTGRAIRTGVESQLAEMEAGPAEAYFVVRGVQEHHVEAIEAVLERHDLLLVAEDDAGYVHLLGGANPVHRVTWDALARRGRATAGELVEETGLAEEAIAATFTGFALQRVVVRHADGTVSPLSALLEEEGSA
jgi:hypothetical protein